MELQGITSLSLLSSFSDKSRSPMTMDWLLERTLVEIFMAVRYFSIFCCL